MPHDEISSIFFPMPDVSPCADERRAHAFVDALEEARVRAPTRAVGALAVFVETRGRVEVAHVDALDAREPSALIIGSHEACDVVVPEASLRHVVVLAWPERDGAIAIEALDLRTSSGLGHGGLPVRGLSAQGAVAFTVGPHVITVVASASHEVVPAYPDELDARLQRGAPLVVRGLAPRGASAHLPLVREQSDITCEGTVVGLASDREDRRRVRRAAEPIVVDADVATWTSGVVLGRMTRCDHAERLQRPNVSRVHAMLVARGPRAYVVDLGSTNGTQVVDVHTGRVRKELEPGRRVATLTPDDDVEICEHRVIVRFRG